MFRIVGEKQNPKAMRRFKYLSPKKGNPYPNISIKLTIIKIAAAFDK